MQSTHYERNGVFVRLIGSQKSVAEAAGFRDVMLCCCVSSSSVLGIAVHLKCQELQSNLSPLFMKGLERKIRMWGSESCGKPLNMSET
jgi:hypothetical protein